MKKKSKPVLRSCFFAALACATVHPALAGSSGNSLRQRIAQVAPRGDALSGDARTALNEHEIIATENEGVDPSGQEDSSPALNKLVAGGNVRLKLPCGTYLVGQTFALPSSTQVRGSGACTVLRVKKGFYSNPQLAHIKGANPSNKTVVANADFVDGNSDILIRNLTIDASADAESEVVFLMYFYKQESLRIENVKLIGSDNIPHAGGIGVLHSSHIVIQNTQAINLAGGGACISLWDGSHDFLINGNYCDGANRVNFGIQVNGVGTAGEQRTSSKGVVRNNVIKNTRAVGLDFDGLCSSDCGIVQDIVATGNTIDTVSQYFGVRIGHGSNVTLSGNTIRNTERDGIFVGSSGKVTPPTNNITIKDNNIENTNVATTAASAITVGNGHDAPSNIRVVNNTVLGSKHQYAIRISHGAEAIDIGLGATNDGVAGTVSDGGIGTHVMRNR